MTRANSIEILVDGLKELEASSLLVGLQLIWRPLGRETESQKVAKYAVGPNPKRVKWDPTKSNMSDEGCVYIHGATYALITSTYPCLYTHQYMYMLGFEQ